MSRYRLYFFTTTTFNPDGPLIFAYIWYVVTLTLSPSCIYVMYISIELWLQNFIFVHIWRWHDILPLDLIYSEYFNTLRN